MSARRKPLALQQGGFTLVELMIATVVFSVVLLIITVGILQISRVYIKGTTENATQNTARTIMDTISQSIQFGGGNVATTTGGAATPGSPKAFCVGSQRYTYALGYQVVDGTPNGGLSQTNHALASDSIANCSQTTVQSLNGPTISGRELLAPNMRLSKFEVNQVSGSTNLYRVTIRIVYGDNDLLDDPTSANARCKGAVAGTQFCAMSELSTVVVKRVQ